MAAIVRWAMALLLVCASGLSGDEAQPENGVLPRGDDGRKLNLDFETGRLDDWTATGNAFTGQPIKGDTVHARGDDMRSRHSGEYWVGTYEIDADGPRGTLTSKPFTVTHPWAKFLIGGGSTDASVDIVLADTHELFFHATGDNREDMEAVAVDLRPVMRKRIYLRIVDDHSFGWGHINFDDFKFHSEEPKVPQRVILTSDVVKHAGLPPDEAAKAMSLPAGFKANVFAGEPDVNQPIGFCLDDRGRLWVAEAWNYPLRAPGGEGKDRIIILEDTDGDGKADKRTVFAEKLNLVSGIEVGFGGVWVGAAPYLLFIPDRDADDKPDGEPQILLDGWAWQDTHETLNGFNWGPDGWLYGCHGVFTHSLVGKPAAPDEQRIPLNAAIWRYHPTKHIFEVFAEGTSNPWGVDFNDHGQAFATACVIPHLYHIIQGARYQRQAGSHFNPYIYRDIPTIADHVHWLGDQGPHAGNEKSGEAGGGHAHCGAMIYLADSWPAEYRNSIFIANIHGNRVNNDRLEQSGSGYIGHHAPDPILMNDKWARLINLKYGPDGAVYLIDWYDKQACHNPIDEIWDRTNGRIYKISYSATPGQSPGAPGPRTDLAKLSNDELIKLQLHANDWYVRHARRLLQERGGGEPNMSLRDIAEPQTPPQRLRVMWALHCAGGLTDQELGRAMQDENEYVRAWAIQLAFEDLGPVNPTVVGATPASPFSASQQRATQESPVQADLLRLAQSDPSPVVRLYIASALQRMPVEDRWPILEALVAHSEDANDHNLPLMYWYAAEPAVGADHQRAVELAKKSAIPLLRELIARRLCGAAVASAESDSTKVDLKPLATLATLLGEIDDPEFQQDVLRGMLDGLKGWQRLPAPDGWASVYEKLGDSDDQAIKSGVQQLSVIFGDERALAALRETAADPNARAGARREAILALIGARDSKLVPLLQELLREPALQSEAIRGLAAFDEPETPTAIVGAYATFDAQTKVDALNTLASRVEYADALRAAVDAGKIAKADLTAATLRQLASLENAEIQAWLADTFGAIRMTPESKLREIGNYKSVLSRGNAFANADAASGRAVFAKVCVQCHVLFDTGGKVGPDLTGSNRADLDYILTNVIDPSAVIGKDYLMSVIRTKNKRILSGIVRADDGNALTVQTESETLTIPKSEVELQKQQSISMMPEGLFKGLKPDEVRDLVAYLRSPRQALMLATRQNAISFFNGKDLTLWEGDPKLWRVEDGEIVGKTSGLEKNNFLRSQMLVGDFRLTLQVKLINNEGNSGIQFRSEALEDGDVKGYQADIGPGWWGKLYEENGRKLLWPPAPSPGTPGEGRGEGVQSPEQHVKPGEWNHYEIVAKGSRIQTYINGNLCVDLNDPDGAERGIIAFQLHSGPAMEARFKDIKLEVEP